ncbi:MAG: polysaccharide biosynthesis/export family protein [Bacteroidales bacterium]|nr:polysaccharide biosynthesis/export family protein [Bacteroidales bacterium]
MKNYLLLLSKLSFILIVFILLFSSCVPQKRIKYLQNKSESEAQKRFFNRKQFKYRIQPGDNLYIRINSLDEQANLIFNNETKYTLRYLMNEFTIFLYSYIVNEEGCIDFPIVGCIIVKNLTTEQIRNKLKEILKEYLKEATIIVKLVNFNITLIGEVRSPGEYDIYQDELNIFEAFALAGDLTDFANRNHVLLVRQTKQGSTIHKLDLTDDKILESDYYYLMPNDIIYIEPLKGKQFTFANFPYNLMFAAISTTILLIYYFK